MARILVVCKGEQELDVIDLATGRSDGRIRASGFTPHEVTATADGTTAYLPIYSDAWLGDPGTDGRAIDVVDLVDLRITRTIRLDVASRPHQPAVGPDGRLYVSTELDDSVSVLDPAAGTRVGRLPTGRAQSHMFAMAPDGSRVYSANVDSGTVSVIDVATEELVDVIAVAGEINRISVSPDGATLFTADQTNPRLAVIDAATRTVSWIELPSRAFGTAVVPDGRRLVLALRWASQIGVLDLADPAGLRLIDVPDQPQAIVISPDGRFAYSACDAARAVVEVDLDAGAVARILPTGAGADGLCWAPSPDRPGA